MNEFLEKGLEEKSSLLIDSHNKFHTTTKDRPWNSKCFQTYF